MRSSHASRVDQVIAMVDNAGVLGLGGFSTIRLGAPGLPYAGM